MLGFLTGCGYTLGYRPRGNVKTVAVPIFDNRSLRREMEFPLTEAVVREIQRRTPYIVTSPEKADLVLRGTIETLDQGVLVEGASDEVLESSVVVSLGLVAVDREGREVFRYTGPKAVPGVTGPAIVETGYFVQGRGESIASPTADAFRRLAERVVMLLGERMPDGPRSP